MEQQPVETNSVITKTAVVAETAATSKVDAQLLTLAKACWLEDPAARPTVSTVVGKLKLIAGRRQPNITSSLLKRMENYSRDLESIINSRTLALVEEKQRIEAILIELVPRSIAEQILRGEQVKPCHYASATIYQSDLVGFTRMAAAATPIQVTEILNALYTTIDLVIDGFDAYKVQTIGDAYVVASGLPIPNGMRHSVEIFRMALTVHSTMQNFQIPHRPVDERIRMRIGVHTGACAAGVVGLRMPRYCVFGNTVTIAGIMENRGQPNKIHVSQQAKDASDEYYVHCSVENEFVFEKRGDKIKIQDRREIETYWLFLKQAEVNEAPNINR